MEDRAGIVDGLVCGAVATAPMSAWMWAAQRAGAMGRMPPRKLASALSRTVSRGEVRPLRERAAAVLLHFGFGAGAGAVYALASERLRVRGAAPGVAFGLAVWAASYAGWLPAVGLMPPPHRDRAGRPASMIAAHVVYGAVLGTALERARRRRAAGA